MSSREKEDRSLLITLFSRQVSPAVAQKIWAQRNQLLADGRVITQELHATVLVSDLANFTAISKSLTPADLMKWLNEYTAMISDVVEKHGGIVDKYVGDAVLAIFGAPVPATPQASAASAVACALELRAGFAELKSKWNTPLMLGMCMRVGIHTGSMVVGTIGSGEREAYAVIGEAVNMAQRIESHDKDTMEADIAADGCRIIVSDATRQLIGGQFRLRRLGEVPITGDNRLLAIHGVIQ
jgi:adenylate cyclase